MKTMIRFAKAILCSAILLSVAATVNAQADSVINLPNFLFPAFTKSIVKFKSGGTKSAVLNYNVVDQEMVFVQSEGYMVLDNPQMIDSIFIGSRKFIPFKAGFYELVQSGSIPLFIQHKSNVEQEGTPTGYGSTTQTAAPIYQKQVYGPMGSVNLKIPDGYKIVDATEYWVNKDNSMQKFSSRRQFVKIFKDKGKELNQFLDSKSINFKNLSDVIKLINYCNELYN